jgi:SAM-dependent methyltransferase
MQYEPIKAALGRFFSDSLFMRKIFYFLIDLLLLRTWHVRRSLRKISHQYKGKASVLDAGSGFGQYTWRMSKLNKLWNITAIDINGEATEECRKLFGNAGLSGRVTFRTGDLTMLDEADKYDLIITVDVMEHIEEDEKVFRNFFRSMKNNGTLLISTPSDKGGSDVHDSKEDSFIDEHVRAGYSITDITSKLSGAGFSRIESSYTYGIPGNISWRLSMKYPVKMLNVSLLFFIILPIYYIVFFPVSIILNIFDIILTHREGTGLIITARKQE